MVFNKKDKDAKEEEDNQEDKPVNDYMNSGPFAKYK